MGRNFSGLAVIFAIGILVGASSYLVLPIIAGDNASGKLSSPAPTNASCESDWSSSINASEGGVEVYFCPKDDCALKLVKVISDSNNYVYVAIYSFTHDAIAQALLDANARGVDVRVVIEKNDSGSEYSKYRILKNAGLDARLDGNPALMHDKFMVVDGKVVATGSFNYTKNADERNNENLLLVKSESLAAKYLEEFMKIREDAS